MFPFFFKRANSQLANPFLDVYGLKKFLFLGMMLIKAILFSIASVVITFSIVFEWDDTKHVLTCRFTRKKFGGCRIWTQEPLHRDPNLLFTSPSDWSIWNDKTPLEKRLCVWQESNPVLLSREATVTTTAHQAIPSQLSMKHWSSQVAHYSFCNWILIFVFTGLQLTDNYVGRVYCQCQDSNCGSLVSEPTALPIAPQLRALFLKG